MQKLLRVGVSVAIDLMTRVPAYRLYSKSFSTQWSISGVYRVSEQLIFQELVQRIRAGDEQAATEVITLYEPLVQRELRIRMTDRRFAKLFDPVDVCQSIWSSFFIRLGAGQFDLESPKCVAKLLVAMTHNKLASRARKHYAQKRSVDRVDDYPWDLATVADSQDSPSVYLTNQELMVKIHENLSDEERKLSELRNKGLSWQAVADAVGGTAQARRMQLDRAAERVIKQLGLQD